jgi:DNA transposition AAA+ family ATPase
MEKLISEQLKQAIKDSGLTPYAIAKGCGVAQPMLSRFLADDDNHRDIRLERTADKLAAFLGLELTQVRPVATAPKKNGRKKSAKPAARKAPRKKKG